jgi:DNA repair ATPase RecN
VKRPKIDEYNALLEGRAKAAAVHKILAEQHASGYSLSLNGPYRVDPCLKQPRTSDRMLFGDAFREELEAWISERQHQIVAEVMARLDARIAKAAEAARSEVRALLTEVETAGEPSNFEITDLGSVLAKLFELQPNPKPAGGAQ